MPLSSAITFLSNSLLKSLNFLLISLQMNQHLHLSLGSLLTVQRRNIFFLEGWLRSICTKAVSLPFLLRLQTHPQPAVCLVNQWSALSYVYLLAFHFFLYIFKTSVIWTCQITYNIWKFIVKTNIWGPTTKPVPTQLRSGLWAPP